MIGTPITATIGDDIIQVPTRWYRVDMPALQKAITDFFGYEETSHPGYEETSHPGSKGTSQPNGSEETSHPLIQRQNTKQRERGAARAAAPSSVKHETDPAIEEIARALSDVTGQDSDLNSAKLIKAARPLAQKSPDAAALIRKHYGRGGWWYREDWRGKKGERPKLANINETWGQWGSTPEQSSKPKKVRR